MTRSPRDPAPGVPAGRVAQAVPGEPAAADRPPGEAAAGGRSSPDREDAALDPARCPSLPSPPGAVLGHEAAPGAGRPSQTPAGASLKAHGSPPARPAPLSGEAFRREYGKALARRGASSRGDRGRKTARPAAAGRRIVPSPAIPPPGPDTAPLTSAAHCIGSCDWTAGPGTYSEADKAAEKHTRMTRHATATVAGVGGAG